MLLYVKQASEKVGKANKTRERKRGKLGENPRLTGKRIATKQQATCSGTQNVPCVHTEHIQTLPCQKQASGKVGESKGKEKEKEKKKDKVNNVICMADVMLHIISRHINIT